MVLVEALPESSAETNNHNDDDDDHDDSDVDEDDIQTIQKQHDVQILNSKTFFWTSTNLLWTSKIFMNV